MNKNHPALMLTVSAIVAVAVASCQKPETVKKAGSPAKLAVNADDIVNVEVKFEGLVAFVPLKSGSKIDQVWALLVRADDPSTQTVLAGHKVPLHYGVVRVDAKNLGASVSAPVLLSLSGHDPLHADSDDRDAHDIVLPDPQETALGLDPDLLPSIPAMRLVSASGNENNAFVVGKMLSRPVTDPPIKKLVGRMLITRGTLSVGESMNCKGEFKYYNAQNKPIGTGHTFDHLAQSVILRQKYPVAALPLKLILNSFDGTHSPFVQLSAAKGETIKIDVLDLPLEDVLGLPAFPSQAANGNISEHFALFHRASLLGSPPFVFPEIDPDSCGGGGGKPYCSHVLMEQP